VLQCDGDIAASNSLLPTRSYSDLGLVRLESDAV